MVSVSGAKEMSSLAPLTFHAVPLQSRFPTMEKALEAYVSGCPGLSARESLAVFACVVSMFTHWHDFKLDLRHFHTPPKAAPRLAYACLFALRKMPNSPERDELKTVFTELHDQVAGEPCHLFMHKTNVSMPGSPDPDAALCRVINNSVCHADVLKMVA